MKKYYFKKYYPAFCSGFSSKVDNVEFTYWKSFLKKYEKEFPALDGYIHAYSYHDYDKDKYILMSVSPEKNEWWVIGFTNYPLNKKYKYFIN